MMKPHRRIIDKSKLDPITLLLVKSSQMKDPERNYLIWMQHGQGYSFNTLARMYDITPQRAHAIVKAVRNVLGKYKPEEGGGNDENQPNDISVSTQ